MGAEDLCWDLAADDAVVASAKRFIDAMNATRLGHVEEIDVWASKNILASSAADLHTETLGQLIDRLAITWIRCQKYSQTENMDRARSGPSCETNSKTSAKRTTVWLEILRSNSVACLNGTC